MNFRSGATSVDKFNRGAPHDTITGFLYRPEGKGPFPAVVIQHDRLGLADVHRKWGERLAVWGYVALVLDSKGHRNLMPPSWVWAHDAYGALVYLGRLEFVDADRVAWMGWGNGGGAGIIRAGGLEAKAGSPALPNPWFAGNPPVAFKAAVAWYPRCPGIDKIYYAPVLMLIAGMDDMHFDKCEPTFKESLSGGKPMQGTIYARSTRFFDRPDVKLDRDGLKVFFDPEATGDAISRTREFLDNLLR